MKIFEEDNIVLNAAVSSKAEAIQLVGGILVKNNYVEEEYLSYMLEREKSVSTYIGNHVAIPHGIVKSSAVIKHSGISLAVIPKGVRYDEEEVYLVFGIAGKENEHIEILSAIALKCMDSKNIEQLRTAKTKQEILELLDLDKTIS